MSTPFDAFFDAQKKAMDAWTEWSRTAAGASAKKEPTDWMKDWLEQYRATMQEALAASASPKEAMEKAPEQFRKWMELQQEFARKMMNGSQSTARPFMGMPSPDSWNAFVPGSAPGLSAQFGAWADLMKPGSEWMRKMLFEKLPPIQQGHFLNFEQLFGGMTKYWNDFQKMIQYGMSNKDMIDRYFSPEAYRDFVSGFMGFQPIHKPHELIDRMNEVFDQYFGQMEELRPRMEQWTEQVQNHLGGMMKGEKSPFFQLLLDMKHVMRDGLDTGFNLAGTAREVQLARLMKDLQFGFGAYVVRSAELQSQVYEAGQFALPETIRHYAAEFSKSRTMPSYEEFFTHYINELEKGMLNALESEPYAKAQNEVARLGIEVKAMADQLTELAFSDFPFLMSSHADEVAREMHTMRAKMRKMDERLRRLEYLEAESANGADSGHGDPATLLLKSIGRAPAEAADDLKRIRGIGPRLESQLHQLGIRTYKQIACLTDSGYELLDTLIDTLQGRARRDEWAEQAKRLIATPV